MSNILKKAANSVSNAVNNAVGSGSSSNSSSNYSTAQMLGVAAGGLGISGIIGLANNTLGSWIGNYFGKKQANYLNKLQLNQYNAQRALDWDYYKMQSEYELGLAEQYARNSAKWQMQGLEDAGLNPLLAVTQGGSMPQQISMSDASATGGSLPSQGGDFSNRNHGSVSITNALRDVASAQYAQSTARTEAERPSLVAAEKENTLAQAAVARANAAKTLATTAADLEKVNAEINLIKRKTDVADRPKSDLAETADWALRRTMDGFKAAIDWYDTRQLFAPFNNSDTHHSARTPNTTVVTPHSANSQHDFEQERVRILQRLAKERLAD